MSDQYVTKQGDTWDMVSLTAYGTEKSMGELIAANPAYRNVVVFSAGAVLTLPVLAKTVNNLLPPWKRG